MYGFAKDWQTLFAAGVALWAAYVGANAIYRQTLKTEQLAQDEISRRHNAARCVLPLALSEVSTLCQSMANKIAEKIEIHAGSDCNLYQAMPILGAGSSKFDPITAPPYTLKAFKDFVQTLTDSSNVAHVGQLMAQIQILIARWDTFDLNQIAPDIRLIELLIDVARVKLLNDTIFNYARMVGDEHFSIVSKDFYSDAWDSIRGKTRELLFHRDSPDLFFGQINTLIDYRKEHNISPWLERFEW